MTRSSLQPFLLQWLSNGFYSPGFLASRQAAERAQGGVLEGLSQARLCQLRGLAQVTSPLSFLLCKMVIMLPTNLEGWW